VKLTPGGRLPRAFVRQVQERYPSWHLLGRPASIEEDLASLVADRPGRPEELAARLLPLLGDRWVTSQGQPLNDARLRQELYGLQSVLIGLDLIQADDGTWAAGPSARWLLPRATALADIWSKAQASS
jgi:hypothetical protein